MTVSTIVKGKNHVPFSTGEAYTAEPDARAKSPCQDGLKAFKGAG